MTLKRYLQKCEERMGPLSPSDVRFLISLYLDAKTVAGEIKSNKKSFETALEDEFVATCVAAENGMI